MPKRRSRSSERTHKSASSHHKKKEKSSKKETHDSPERRSKRERSRSRSPKKRSHKSNPHIPETKESNIKEKISIPKTDDNKLEKKSSFSNTNNPLVSMKIISKTKIANTTLQNNKPVFLSKKERERLKEEEEKEKKHEEKEKKKDLEKIRDNFLHHTTKSYSSSDVRHRSYSERDSRDSHRSSKREEKRITEQDQINQMYLGKKTAKKRVILPSQKFKFNFDWDADDDTTASDINPLYKEKAQVNFDFGRGFIAGIDRIEQRKKNRFFDELAEKRIKEGEVAKPFIEPEKQQYRLEKDKARIEQQEINEKHWSDKSLENMAERDWRIFREDFNINSRGGRIPHPIRYWKETNLPGWLINAIEDMKFEQPMPIQRQTIPIGLMNRDLMGVAETGSGKTLAFIIPLLIYINDLPTLTVESALEGPYSLILAPTRELALQINDEFIKFAKNRFRSCVVVGGGNIEDQAFQLRNGVEVVIATPGRLVDLLHNRYIVLNQCNYVVLDEADRMLDMGFEPQVIEILDAMPSSNLKPMEVDENDLNSFDKKIYRQTFMFSATMPATVEALARTYLRHPIFISIGDKTGKIVDTIEQKVVFLSDSQKRNRLLVVMNDEIPPIIIFCNVRRSCDHLKKFLDKEGWNCVAIHGGKTQDMRDDALNRFKEGKIDVLIATDLAGRGIDVEGITHVINYDCPKNIEGYTHRIGRTGRAGASGKATTFITEENKDIFWELKQLLLKSNAAVPPELMNHEAALVKPGEEHLQKNKPKIMYAKK